jgi:hypothetical protein
MGQESRGENLDMPQQMWTTRTTQPIEASFDRPTNQAESFQNARADAASTTSQASRQDETTRRQAGTDASRPTRDALSAIVPMVIERASSFGVGSGWARGYRLLPTTHCDASKIEGDKPNVIR